MLTGRVLVARADNLGDVLLTGPAVRSIAASGAKVTYLCSPQGEPAATCLPGVTDLIVTRLPWIDARPPDADLDFVTGLADQVRESGTETAVIFTSFHQSPLPLALVLRMAGVGRIAAISVDYPGSLLDLRHSVPDDIHEVERNLSLAEAAGFPQPAGDDGRLRVDVRRQGRLGLPPGYVVVHAGASVPARAWGPEGHADLVARLLGEGYEVVLTGGPAEQTLVGHVAAVAATRAPAGRGRLHNLCGQTDFTDLVAVMSGAAALVCANTGPAHIAAATATPVISIYAPTVPAVRWRPWRTPHVLLGDQDVGCAGCRARVCPVPGHPCVSGIDTADVLAALRRFAGERAQAAS